MRDGFIFYGSFGDAIWDLPDEERLAAYDAISKYALTGEEPQLSGIVSAVFKLVRPQIDANLRKREAGQKGSRSKANNKQDDSKAEANNKQDDSKAEANTKQDDSNMVAKYKYKDKEKYKEKDKEKDKEKRFVRPTVEEVDAYCRERKNSVDAKAFVDFYESKGWRVGNAPMKDWKACVRTWERRRDARRTTEFNNIEARKYDMDELEKELAHAVDYTGR